MVYQTAARLEKDVAKNIPRRAFTAPNLPRTAMTRTASVCARCYRPLPAEEPVKASYLFRQKQGSWVLERELAKTETVDIEKGIIQKRPSAAKPKPKSETQVQALNTPDKIPALRAVFDPSRTRPTA